MTKKEFVMLANYLRQVEVPKEVLDTICDFCKAANSQFNEEIFKGYMKGTCGPRGGEK